MNQINNYLRIIVYTLDLYEYKSNIITWSIQTHYRRGKLINGPFIHKQLKYIFIDYNKQFQRQQLASINIWPTTFHANSIPISWNINLQN